MKGWLKAGLIGLGILVVLSLLSLIPIMGLCVIPLRWITYIGVGVLAGSYMLPPRESGDAAKDGAMAGAVAAAGGGFVGLIISLIQGATGGAMQFTEIMQQLPPEAMQGLRDLGVTPEMLTGVGGGAAALGGAAVCGSVCCVGGILFAAISGAIGGAVYASMKSS
jgi:hypothetical protein